MLAQVEERAAALQPLLRLKRAEARVEELEGRLEESKSACRKAAKRRRILQCVEVSNCITVVLTCLCRATVKSQAAELATLRAAAGRT
jgi:hypothetical protein